MAKKKKKKSPELLAAAANDWLTSSGYTLTIQNGQKSFGFDLETQDGSTSYHLRVNNPNSDVGKVQSALRAIADKWPSYAFEFQTDGNGKIVDAR